MKLEIKMELKKLHEIENCEKEKIIILNLYNRKTYTGVFKGIDDDGDIMLDSLSGKNTISLKMNWINDYFEQID